MPEAFPPLLIEPPPQEWGGLLLRRDEAVRPFRAALGLPVGGPVVMSGHQPGLWHCGILAKFLASGVAARALGAANAWLIVDQDAGDAGEVAWPERQAGGRWARQTARLLAGDPPPADVPFGMQPPGRPSLPPPFARLARPVLTGDVHGEHASVAGQFAAALVRELTELGAPPAGVAFATDLHRTALFGELLDRMAADPHACVSAYNAAVAAHPGAGMRPLILRPGNGGEGRIELPLWRVRPNQPRLPVYAHELSAIPRHELAPRALLMTGLVRLAGCDLFIHGTGGGDYDPASERWFRDWLPDLVEAVGFAPMVVVSATRRLPLDAGPGVEPGEVDRAVWLAHHARHDPNVLGDATAADDKRRCLEDIARERENGGDPAPTFAEMHAVLEQYRAAHVDELRRLQEHARDARARLLDAGVISDRTYPFVLFPPEALHALRREIEQGFAPPEPRVLPAREPALRGSQG